MVAFSALSALLLIVFIFKCRRGISPAAALAYAIAFLAIGIMWFFFGVVSIVSLF